MAVPPQRSPSPTRQPTSQSGFDAVLEAFPGDRDGVVPGRLADLLGAVPPRGPAADGAGGAVPQGKDNPTGGRADAGSPPPADEESLPSGQAALEAMTAPPPPAPTTPGPSLPVIPPRPRVSGPSRPALLPGSLMFGGGAAGSSSSSSSGCLWALYGEATMDVYSLTTVNLGVVGRLESATQPVDVHGASMLLPAAAQYTIYFDVALSTWDSYNAYQGNGTGYWDSFSVSVTDEPYPYRNWSDPVATPFRFGGQLGGDGRQDTLRGPYVITVSGNPVGSNYLNVVLDTFSSPEADPRYPSWGTISITRITTDGPNIPPTAVNDAYSVLHDTTLTANGREELDVLFNDCNLDRDPLTARLVGSPPPGSLTFNPDGTFTYTPPAGFFGQVSFMYVANDGTTDSNPATVTINVYDNAPVAQADRYDLPPNTSFTETAPGVLGNDYDPDGDSKTAVFEPGHGPYNGTIDYFMPDGTFRYTPDTGFVGTDTFAYRVFDGILQSVMYGLVTLVVNAEERVSFLNKDRGGDRVVPARNLADGLLGGDKTFEVQAIPHNAVVDLRILRQVGTTGSAHFRGTLLMSDPIRLMGAADGRYSVTIDGLDVSSQPRNLWIRADINFVERGNSETFTVFRIGSITAYTTGKARDVVPNTVTNHHPEMLRGRIEKFTLGTGDLGHQHRNEKGAWGGIVLRGRIAPSGMDRADFFKEGRSRNNSFNWDRTISGRRYDGNGCIRMNLSPDFRASDELTDDQQDNDEDLTPGNDVEPNELYIWSYDVAGNSPEAIPTDGEVNRTRYQFTEHVTYARTKVSSDVPWYWRSSQENPPGDTANFRQNIAVAGDNRVQSGATTPLTWNLGASTIPGDFSVTASAPAAVTRPAAGQLPAVINATIDGTRLNSGAPCRPLVYWVLETGNDKQTFVYVIPLTIPADGITAARIQGTFNVSADTAPGNTYKLKVFIVDQARTRNDALAIN